MFRLFSRSRVSTVAAVGACLVMVLPPAAASPAAPESTAPDAIAAPLAEQSAPVEWEGAASEPDDTGGGDVVTPLTLPDAPPDVENQAAAGELPSTPDISDLSVSTADVAGQSAATDEQDAAAIPSAWQPAGAIGTYWVKHRDLLGLPTGPETVGLARGAAVQGFERGSVYWVPQSGTYRVAGAIGTAWGARGWESGALGYPTSQEESFGRGAVQHFEGATIVWSPERGTLLVGGAIRTAWRAAGGASGALGVPMGPERGLGAGAAYQDFAGGSVHYLPARGAFAVRGAIYHRWAASGWERGLGYPTGPERSLTGGGAVQYFERAALYYSPQHGARSVSGGVLTGYQSERWEQGFLGYPRTESRRVGGVWVQDFQGGVVLFDARTGHISAARGGFQNGVLVLEGAVIANKTFALPASYAPGGLRPETQSAFSAMRSEASRQGLSLYIASGYRSYATQDALYQRYVRESGQAAADRFSARPGHSEHQTGLALDVNSTSGAFGSTPEGRWVRDNAHRFGFIVRYPQGKEHITGYMYEPWHLRWVGHDLAARLYSSGLTMEEYFGLSSRY